MGFHFHLRSSGALQTSNMLRKAGLPLALAVIVCRTASLVRVSEMHTDEDEVEEDVIPVVDLEKRGDGEAQASSLLGKFIGNRGGDGSGDGDESGDKKGKKGDQNEKGNRDKKGDQDEKGDKDEKVDQDKKGDKDKTVDK